MKLASKRPEVTAKQLNDYIEANKAKVIEPSKLDFGINDDDIVAPIVAKQKLQSDPHQKLKQLFKRWFQQNYIIGL